MRSFDHGKLEDRTWPTDILNLVAKIQSTEVSNKIEGIVTTDARMKQLFAEKTAPRNRNEHEIMGH